VNDFVYSNKLYVLLTKRVRIAHARHLGMTNCALVLDRAFGTP
jgi:hypothetical protein